MRVATLFCLVAFLSAAHREAMARNDEGTPVGGLRWEGGVLVPCPLGWRPSESRSSNGAVESFHQRSQVDEERETRDREERDQRARAELERQQRRDEGLTLNRLGYEQYLKSNWEEAVRLYSQAVEKLPDHADLRGNLLMAQVALRHQRLQRQVQEEHRQKVVKSVAEMGEGLESLCNALSALRRDAGWALIEQGKLEAVMKWSAQPDSLMDSRVVDLRHVKEGVVNLDVLRPPPSQSEAVDFPGAVQNPDGGGVDVPRAQPESKDTGQARAVLCAPDVDAILFSATIEEAVQDRKDLSGERADRFAVAVANELCKRAGVRIRSTAVTLPGGGEAVHAVGPEQQAFHRQMKDKASEAYAAYLQQRASLRNEAYEKFKDEIANLEKKMRNQGDLREGETLYTKEQNDPAFRDHLKPEYKAMVLRYEVNQLANQHAAYAGLLNAIGKLLTIEVPK